MKYEWYSSDISIAIEKSNRTTILFILWLFENHNICNVTTTISYYFLNHSLITQIYHCIDKMLWNINDIHLIYQSQLKYQIEQKYYSYYDYLKIIIFVVLLLFVKS